MKLKRRRARAPVTLLTLLLLALPAGGLGAEEQDIETLRRQVEAQQQKLAEQAAALRRQQAALDEQRRELAALAESLAALAGEAAAAPAGPQEAPAAAAQVPAGGFERDPVGDLNAAAVAAGDFPGSFRIPGSRDVSLAIGGFVKAVAIADSDLEGAGAIFLPASIGTSLPDENGNFGMDASLTRLTVDARAPAKAGSLRGYVEWDLNGRNDGSASFNLRHAYGVWDSGRGTLTLGHTWSTLMDLQILPEGLTEPTLSGAIFQRQAQLRWTRPFSAGVRFDLALEDPSNRDVILNEPAPAPSRLPDLIAATQWDWPARGHLRVTGILRRFELGEAAATGWGFSTGAHLNVLENDKIAVSATYGEGVGRYLLGLPAAAGGFLDPDDGELRLLTGWGGLATYRHAWSESVRSTFALGRAEIDLDDAVPASAFRNSLFGFANLMMSPLPYLTLGVEYQYGRREDLGGGERENHRLIFGVQVY